jgi:hypothetical protein
MLIFYKQQKQVRRSESSSIGERKLRRQYQCTKSFYNGKQYTRINWQRNLACIFHNDAEAPEEKDAQSIDYEPVSAVCRAAQGC